MRKGGSRKICEERKAKVVDGESTPVKKAVQNKAKREDEMDVDDEAEASVAI